MKRWLLRWFSCFAVALATIAFAVAEEGAPSDVQCLLDENVAELLPKLTNPGGDGGNGEVESLNVFSGKSSVKISVLQRYCNFIDGWAFRIREAPKAGEFRYLRFAWRSEGLAGIMLQLHDDKDWHIRYVAGANPYGWTSQTVAAQPPAEWALVTIDLFKDFGEREIHGIAFTVFQGGAGYFDHVYLGRSIESLDAIDGLALGGEASRDDDRNEAFSLSEVEVETHVNNLSSTDASIAYRAFWTLAAADASVRTDLLRRLGGAPLEIDSKRIAEWIAQLDDDHFDTREKATTSLLSHLPMAREQVRDELTKTLSLEVRYRLEMILECGEPSLDVRQETENKLRRIVAIIEKRQAK